MEVLGNEPFSCRFLAGKVMNGYLVRKANPLSVIDPASLELVIGPELPKTLSGILFKGAERVNHPNLIIQQAIDRDGYWLNS